MIIIIVIIIIMIIITLINPHQILLLVLLHHPTLITIPKAAAAAAPPPTIDVFLRRDDMAGPTMTWRRRRRRGRAIGAIKEDHAVEPGGGAGPKVLVVGSLEGPEVSPAMGGYVHGRRRSRWEGGVERVVMVVAWVWTNSGGSLGSPG